MYYGDNSLLGEALLRQAVWQKGRQIPNFDPGVWRWDFYGAVIKFDEYGQQTKYGWEIDHIVPVARGGSDDSSNLQPLQWENNRTKGGN